MKFMSLQTQLYSFRQSSLDVHMQ